MLIRAVAVAALLAGCSSASSPPSPSSVAARAGCTGFHADNSFVLFVREMGECDLDGNQITVSTFNNNGARDSWLKVAKDFGGTFGSGNLWVISGTDADAVAQATKAARGSS